jgi:hypothetical protein
VPDGLEGARTSFSQSWSVLSPSGADCPASVPSFPGSRLRTQHKRLGETPVNGTQ